MIEIILAVILIGLLIILGRIIQKQKQLISMQFQRLTVLENSEIELSQCLQTLRYDLDLTHQKFHDLQKKMESNNHAKSIFLNNMSHEFRTPMNGVLGLTHLLLEEDLSIKQKEYVCKINSSAKSLLEIINEILDFSKVEAGRLTLQNESTQIHELLEHVVETTAPLVFDKGLEFIVELNFIQLPKILADKARLSQILCNLLSNAIKFTESGYIRLKVHLVYQMDHELKMRFTIYDGGLGAVAEKQKIIFEQIQNLDDSAMSQFGGTGLGLAISRQLARLMGSEIQLNSHASKGSEFYFDLNFSIIDSESLPDFQPIQKQVFLLEPLDELRLSTDQLMGRLGLQATVFSTIEDLIESLEVYEQSSELPQLILIDESYASIGQYSTLISFVEEKLIPYSILRKTNRTYSNIPGSVNSPSIFKPLYTSHFYYELQRIFNSRSNQIITCMEETKKNHKFQGQKILLVEDLDLNIMVAKEILESMNLQVKVAMNGLDAVEMAQTELFDLILMDVQMPIMDGYQATRAIRNLGAEYVDIPIVAMTANALENDIENCTQSGMNGHIPKPIDPVELNHRIAQYL